MWKMSHKETAGIIAVVMTFGVVLSVLIVKSLRAATEPGITLRETFSQPPGGPPPGRPALANPTVSTSASEAKLPVAASNSTTVNAANSSSLTTAPTASDSAANQTPGAASISANPATSINPGNPVNEIVVHVAGAVKKPGVYHLPAGARNDEAIAKAGGPTSEANTDGINLAARIEDGSQLYLPTHKQHPEGGADAPTTTAAAVPMTAVSSPTAKAGSKANPKTSAHPSAKSAGGVKGSKPGKLSDPAQGTVNINTASMEELQRIPGIGPAMAERILDFRKQNGKFTAPEDLLQISGVGEKKFAKMQPFVRVH